MNKNIIVAGFPQNSIKFAASRIKSMI